MVITLLLLIVAILLFGAGVVKGWLANLLGVVLGLALAIAVIVLVVSAFGEPGAWALLLGGGGLLLILSVWARSQPNIAQQLGKQRLEKRKQRGKR